LGSKLARKRNEKIAEMR